MVLAPLFPADHALVAHWIKTELTDEEILEKKQGKGTFLKFPKLFRDINKILSFTEVCKINGVKPGALVLNNELIQSRKTLLKKLDRPPNEKVLYLSRLRFVDGEPMVIEKNYFPITYSFLMSEDLESRSLFDILKNKYQIEVGFSRREIEICHATKEEAELLDIEFDSALLLMNSIAYSYDSNPIFVGKQIINGEKFKLTM